MSCLRTVLNFDFFFYFSTFTFCSLRFSLSHLFFSHIFPFPLFPLPFPLFPFQLFPFPLFPFPLFPFPLFTLPTFPLLTFPFCFLPSPFYNRFYFVRAIQWYFYQWVESHLIHSEYNDRWRVDYEENCAVLQRKKTFFAKYFDIILNFIYHHQWREWGKRGRTRLIKGEEQWEKKRITIGLKETDYREKRPKKGGPPHPISQCPFCGRPGSIAWSSPMPHSLC